MDSNPDSPEAMEFMGEDSSGSEDPSSKTAPAFDPLQTSDTQGSSSLGGDQNIIGSEDIEKLLREGGEESIQVMDDMSRDPIGVSRRSSSGGNEREGNEEAMRDPISVSRTSPEGSATGSGMGDETSRDPIGVGEGGEEPAPKGMNLSSLEEFVMQETSGALERDKDTHKGASSGDQRDSTGSGSQYDKTDDDSAEGGKRSSENEGSRSEANRVDKEGNRVDVGDNNESGDKEKNDRNQEEGEKEPSGSAVNETSHPSEMDTTQDEDRGPNSQGTENTSRNLTNSESEAMEVEEGRLTTKRLRGVRFRGILDDFAANGGDSCDDGDDPDDPDYVAVEDEDPISTSKKGKSSKKRKTMADEDDDDIVEVPVIKKPAMVVDLSDEEDEGSKHKKENKNKDTGTAEADKSGEEKDEQGNPRHRVLLRSLTSLMNSEDNTSNNKEGAGDIEHGDIIGAEEVDGMHLKISSVMSGEDCITGLTFEDETDGFPNIQISSVTSILDEEEEEQEGRAATAARDSANREGEEAGEKNKSDKEKTGNEKDGGGIRVVNLESLAAKTSSSEDKEDDDSSHLRITTVLSDAVVEPRTGRAIEPHTIYHILYSPIMSQKQCKVCGITKICQYRITLKPVNDTIGFLCSTECRSMWTGCLSPGKAVEKARILFDKVCGLCGKDISSISLYKYDIYAWETREFCSKKCLVSHLQEVASKCHRCNGSVRTMYIGKYCVRFGSDIHQFCSNVCLEQFKSTIEVCNYCQKNLKGVSDITTIEEKKYCSPKCARRAHRTDIGQRNYNERDKCTVCSKENTCSRYELINNSEVHRLCSDPCLNAYKYANKLKAVVCCLCLRVLNAETVTNFVYHNSHQLRIFCSDSCMNVFILTVRKIVVCRYCMVKKYNFDMIHKQDPGQGSDKYYCSVNCLTLATQNQNSNKPDAAGQAASSSNATSSTSNSLQTSSNTNSTTGTTTAANSTGGTTATIAQCNMCGIMATPQYHMVMSDNTLCNFCNYSCAIKYKSTYGYHVATTTASGTGLPGPEPSTADASTGTITQSQVAAEGEGNLPQIKKTMGVDTSPIVKKGKHCQTMADMLKLLEPPPMQNKTTMCRPNQCTKAVYCRPHPWHKGVQTDPCPAGEGSSPVTDDKNKTKGILPVPVPVYVPSPMMMYNAPCPVPIFIPLPVPVPVFIPTTAKTSEDVAKYIKGIMEKSPSDPFEAEMLMLTNASGEEEPSSPSSSPSSSFKHGKEARTEDNDVASPWEGTEGREGYSAYESGTERRGDERREDGTVRDFHMEWEDVTSRLDHAEERGTERKMERENAESSPPSPSSNSRDDFPTMPSSAAISTATPNSLVPADATTTNTSSTISPPTTPPASTTATASPATSDIREELENEEFICSSGHEGGLVLDEEERIYLQELIGNIPTYTIRHDHARGVSGEDSSKRLGYHEDLPPPKRFKADPRLEQSILEVQLPTTLGGGPYLDQRVGLTAWRYWLYHKNAQLSPSSWGAIKDLLSMDCEELNQTLCLFLRDLRRSKRTFYQPDIIYYMLLGLQQFLFESGRTDCIFMDFAFEKFSSCFQEVTQSFLDQLAASALSSSVRVMTCIHEEVLWESKQLGAHTPHVLINSLFYFNTKVFKLKTVEEHMSLSFVQIVKQWRRSNDHLDNRTSLLKYFPKKGFREEGSDASSLHELHENLHNPLRCPVKLYEFYLSKCPDSVRTHPSMYYVYPVRACDPDAPVWFSNQGVQPATLHKMLQRTLMVSEVQQALGAQVVC